MTGWTTFSIWMYYHRSNKLLHPTLGRALLDYIPFWLLWIRITNQSQRSHRSGTVASQTLGKPKRIPLLCRTLARFVWVLFPIYLRRKSHHTITAQIDIPWSCPARRRMILISRRPKPENSSESSCSDWSSTIVSSQKAVRVGLDVKRLSGS
jgi:hypothetical protein